MIHPPSTARSALLALALTLGLSVEAEHIHSISIDGAFEDWARVRAYSDPAGGPGVLHSGVPDTHDTDHSGAGEIPSYVSHPDIDLVEFKFTHDEENLYAYFRAAGQIGRTASGSPRGRYYVIVTIDVDDNDLTGYGLHEGGYYPPSRGYDMNMEVEFYDGAFNTGHYLNHGARNSFELSAASVDQRNGIVRVLPGTYDFYTQWVWFDQPTAGTFTLPAPDDFASITFVSDRGPVYQGILRIALSADGHEAEMQAPFRGFMRDPMGQPILALGRTIDISFSLEASGELAPDGSWASDTGDPIVGYHLSPYRDAQLTIRRQDTELLLAWEADAIGLRLEQTPSLSDPDWQYLTGTESTNRVSVPAGDGNVFFRLVEP